MEAPKSSSTNIARMDRLVINSSAIIVPAAAVHQPLRIIWMPLQHEADPRPSTMPTTTAGGTHFASRPSAPVKPSVSQISPVATPAT